MEDTENTSPIKRMRGPDGKFVKSDVKRETPAPQGSRGALVEEWLSKISAAKDYWADDFKRMRDDMQLARVGADKEWAKSDAFIVPIIPRYINQVVATLYAKNPTVVVEPKKRINYKVWDGTEDALQAAMASIAQSAQPPVDPMTGLPGIAPPPDPEAIAILQEAMLERQNKAMLKRVCKTMEILLQYYFQEQTPNFKKQLKQYVRRTKICGIGYIFLGYQRVLEKNPSITAEIADASAQIARIESMAADYQDGVIGDESARLEELKSMVADLQAKQEIIVREGPVFEFPRSTEIIFDPEIKQLNTLVGADWFVREFHLRPSKIQEVFKVDVRGAFKVYTKDQDGKVSVSSSKESDNGRNNDKGDSLACVWEVWCKSTGQTFTLVDGYKDFIKEPAAPYVQLERFWPLFPLTFNDTEHETEVYPLSDVHMLRHSQMEYNRSREARREHRIANKPAYATVKGKLSNEDKIKLQTRPSHAVLELNALQTGETIESVLQMIKPAPMDPALYETNSEMEDVLRTVGAQEANLGGTSGGTATESSIAEGSRMSALDSNVDDLDEILSELVSATGELLLLNLTIDTVKKIAGPGAEWPQMARSEIIEQIYADIRAGSSGRPNRAAELANMERAMPTLLQMQGVPAKPLALKYADLLSIDAEDMVIEGMPSQVAMNAMAAKIATQPTVPSMGTAPAAQGAMGGANAPTGPGAEPGPQPAFPTPNPTVT